MNIMNKNCRGFRVAAGAKVALLITVAAMFLGTLSGAAIAEPVWENGEYRIYTSADLEIMSGWVNNMHSADVKYRLMNDIDLGGLDIPWLPIGETPIVAFNGEFNGGGHEIRNFVISGGADCTGLFGTISSDAKILDVKVISFDVTGGAFTGGLVGLSNGGSISSSHVSGVVRGLAECVGGLVGTNDGGSISASSASGTISGYQVVGGLTGENNNNATISFSYASGAVSGTGECVGGLVGRNSGGRISTSYASGMVSGDERVGGLVGRNYIGTINTSYASGEVRGNWYVGGLAGSNLDIINTSYASGVVTGGMAVGGLVGWNTANGAITTSYNN